MIGPILHVASEVAPWVQTGGLGDVVGALPAALARAGAGRVATIAPAYRQAVQGRTLVEVGAARHIAVGRHRLEVRLLCDRAAPDVGWLDCPPLYDRDGLYGPPGGGDFADNAVRFAALAHGALALAPSWLGVAPALVHGHDWQGALAVYLAAAAGIPTALTIHNLAFRGLYPKATVEDLGLPWSDFVPSRLEFYDQLCLLKAGMTAADVVTTVSPTYAREILSPPADEGLGGCLRHDVRRLVGITNGIDLAAWDPARDPAIAAPFSAAAPTGRARCAAALRAELGFPHDGDALLGCVTRLSGQKGVDLVLALAPELEALGARLVVLGRGEAALESALGELARARPTRIAVRSAFDLALARRIYAGSDLFLMPSRFEPCGLGQLYAMRYGAVPVVRAVGGLVDTVEDRYPAAGGTGFVFRDADAAGLRWALERALAERRDAPAVFEARRAAAMARDSGWEASARLYVDEYRRVLR